MVAQGKTKELPVLEQKLDCGCGCGGSGCGTAKQAKAQKRDCGYGCDCCR